ncbi:MAG: tetratricopeptide repeat protein [Bryobacterales bacterium]|nr:tetratricopeptide repeat protein [Bryobacterales bacterium]
MLGVVAGALLLLLVVNTAYIAAFSSPTIFYVTNVFVHIGVGLVLTVAAIRYLSRYRLPSILLILSGLLGAWLTYAAAARAFDDIARHTYWPYVIHVIAGAASILILLVLTRSKVLAATCAGAVLLFAGSVGYRKAFPNPDHRIRNPQLVPVSMEEEGAGPSSPFWPSSSNTSVNRTIPSDFFMDSKLCGSCHKDIYEQWNSSMHHFASFNNQFYRKSIEQMQELSGTKGSKWCAGCHDHAVFFNGRFDKPIKDQIDTPEAQNGLGCLSCHSIIKVHGSMGNGGFLIEYPPLHDLASSKNPYIRYIDRFFTFLDPQPHKETFIKPFMRHDAAEYCSSCHKVHLDVPVNNYRWVRGFNDYDNWQASGVSGQGARSFYYPPKTSTCSDCHMPLIDGKDPAAKQGKVHSHRFAAANTAVSHVNGDAKQFKETVDFLQSGFISVDIFAAVPVPDTGAEPQMRRRAAQQQPQLMSTFAVGEEAEHTGDVFVREVSNVAAPLDRTPTKFQPGSTVRVDAVVRTRKIGHFFPGGTVDSFDVWLEFEATDATGRKIFHSGFVEDNGRGPVERGAHMYRSYMLDGAGNPINKRNAWQMRSVLYVRLIPPGAADTVHYRLKIPNDAKGPIQLRAKLNYRKFSHYYTQFAYAGKAEGGESASDHDSRHYTYTAANIPKNVSGNIKGRIPDLPIITLATTESRLQIAAKGEPTEWKRLVEKRDRERWNDWGIGMLLQGDLKGAEYAFQRVTEAEPEYADGWLNVARALIQEGQTEAAKAYLAKAQQHGPQLGRVHFFRAMVEKADGDYDAALKSLQQVAAQYPRDRVVLNQIGRLHFLRREYKQAVEALAQVISVDPEDVQAHYNLMLAYRGMGNAEAAAREEKLFRRFKADEAAQTVTLKPRLLSPEDNNERQQIHDHESVSLPPEVKKPLTSKTLSGDHTVQFSRRD